MASLAVQRQVQRPIVGIGGIVQCVAGPAPGRERRGVAPGVIEHVVVVIPS